MRGTICKNMLKETAFFCCIIMLSMCLKILTHYPKRKSIIKDSQELYKLKLVIELDRPLWCLGTKNFLFNNILLDLDL